jgi:hypothetical protein
MSQMPAIASAKPRIEMAWKVRGSERLGEDDEGGEIGGGGDG